MRYLFMMIAGLFLIALSEFIIMGQQNYTISSLRQQLQDSQQSLVNLQGVSLRQKLNCELYIQDAAFCSGETNILTIR